MVSKFKDIVSVGSLHKHYTETAFGISMNMVWVDGEMFATGCKKDVHHVSIDGFYIGELEVTQGQWKNVFGTTVFQQRDKADPQWPMVGVGDDYPMYYVNWDEAMKFCQLLSHKTGKIYTLPTEVQWEYAARGGKCYADTKYAGSNNVEDVAWYTDNSDGGTHKCGTKHNNALGIYDMSGNVWEWCNDWYRFDGYSYDDYYRQDSESCYYRVKSGGSWGRDAYGCRVDYRGYSSPCNRDCFVGFRVVCIP